MEVRHNPPFFQRKSIHKDLSKDKEAQKGLRYR